MHPYGERSPIKSFLEKNSSGAGSYLYRSEGYI